MNVENIYKQTNHIIVFLLTILFYTRSHGQEVSNSGLVSVSIVDTIIAKDAVIISIRVNLYSDSPRYQLIFVQEKYLDSINLSDSLEFQKILAQKCCFVFFTPRRFQCLLENLMSERSNPKDSGLFTDLIAQIEDAEDRPLWVTKNAGKIEYLKGFEVHRVYEEKFMVCRVLGGSINRCLALDDIRLKKADRLYFNVIIPMSWE